MNLVIVLLRVGRSVEETLRLLKAFQYADSHTGEACPETPGADTIRTNPLDQADVDDGNNDDVRCKRQ